ncbi:hypothetical protein GW17_00027868 [Ensete ventricosum]|nr:hypothetical protein GW17_00027868 [Ensete ventricosum]
MVAQSNKENRGRCYSYKSVLWVLIIQGIGRQGKFRDIAHVCCLSHSRILTSKSANTDPNPRMLAILIATTRRSICRGTYVPWRLAPLHSLADKPLAAKEHKFRGCQATTELRG